MDLINMSKEELNRLEVMGHLQEKRMRQRTAAEILGVSVRQVKRLLRAYRREDAAGLVSKQKRQPQRLQQGLRAKPPRQSLAPDGGAKATGTIKVGKKGD